MLAALWGIFFNHFTVCIVISPNPHTLYHLNVFLHKITVVIQTPGLSQLQTLGLHENYSASHLLFFYCHEKFHDAMSEWNLPTYELSNEPSSYIPGRKVAETKLNTECSNMQTGRFLNQKVSPFLPIAFGFRFISFVYIMFLFTLLQFKKNGRRYVNFHDHANRAYKSKLSLPIIQWILQFASYLIWCSAIKPTDLK